MQWQGKAFGGLIGLVAAGPGGAVIGVLLGALLDARASTEQSREAPRAKASVREAFFRATFQTMGHLAKADGRVSEEEIQAARNMMAALALGERETQRAIALYREGKARDYPLAATLTELYTLCSDRADLCRMFVQIQLQTALNAGALNEQTRRMLAQICATLHVSAYEVVQMEALWRMQRGASRRASAATDRLSEAYEVLGLARSASDREVTKAYRRLMSRNHPDKLVAKGLPESMMKVAEERTRQIRAAYELIREARGSK